MPAISEKMRALGERPMKSRIAATPELIAAFEHRFEVKLPDAYRAFLMEHGATHVDGKLELGEPTPFGETVGIDAFFGFIDDKRSSADLTWATNIVEGTGVMVPIASSSTGDWYSLICTGRNEGRVLLRDGEQRHQWSDEHFARRYPNLHPGIVRWLEMRRAGSLPPPRSHIPGWYVAGDSFEDFVARCQPRTK